MHLVADISGVAWHGHSSVATGIHNWLLDCAKGIDMTPIAGPYVYDQGVAIIGILVIAESHISIHADIPNGRAFVDVFSCKDFDFLSVIADLKKTFGGTIVWNLVKRGLEYLVPGTVGATI